METTSVQRTMEFCCFQKDSLEKKFCRLNEFKIKIFYLIEDLEAQRMNIIMLHYNLLGMLYKHFNFYLWIFDYSWFLAVSEKSFNFLGVLFQFVFWAIKEKSYKIHNVRKYVILWYYYSNIECSI